MDHNKVSASDLVYKTIEEKIFSGEWQPSTKITSEIQLSKDLNVSRMSVREAIEKMVALNLLTKKHGEGTYVNELTPSVYLNSLIPMITLEQVNYLEILEFRRILEVESVRLCTERADDETIQRLEGYYQDMIKYQNDPESFAVADMNFHMTVAEGAGNTIIEKVNKVLKNLLAYHQKGLYNTLGPSGGLKEHLLILNAIKERDTELSVLYMRRHIERAINELKEQNK